MLHWPVFGWSLILTPSTIDFQTSKFCGIRSCVWPLFGAKTHDLFRGISLPDMLRDWKAQSSASLIVFSLVCFCSFKEDLLSYCLLVSIKFFFYPNNSVYLWLTLSCRCYCNAGDIDRALQTFEDYKNSGKPIAADLFVVSLVMYSLWLSIPNHRVECLCLFTQSWGP